MKNFGKDATDFYLSPKVLGTMNNAFFCLREILLKNKEGISNLDLI
jgi:hypothetical protein